MKGTTTVRRLTLTRCHSPAIFLPLCLRSAALHANLPALDEILAMDFVDCDTALTTA